MCEILVHFDHVSLRDSLPNYHQMAAVPREGESLTVAGDTFIVHRVHWWVSDDAEDTQAPAVRLVLRTPEEYRRQLRYNTPV